MDAETQRAVKAAVLDILRRADMESATEQEVRYAAAQRLGIDLSPPDRRLFVRTVVESFLLSGDDHPKENEELEELAVDPNPKGARREREYDDKTGDLILCRLSNNRLVTVHEYRGTKLVSIREYYEKEGTQYPSQKGISLTIDQWKALENSVPAIEDAIKLMEANGYS